jgi:hypothetical protein
MRRAVYFPPRMPGLRLLQGPPGHDRQDGGLILNFPERGGERLSVLLALCVSLWIAWEVTMAP